MLQTYQLKSFLLFFLLVFMMGTEVVFAEASRIEDKRVDSSTAIAKWFANLAEDIDLLLTGKEISNQVNATTVKLENTTFSRESEKVSNRTSLIVSPRFPNLEKYWNLKFTTYDEADEKRNKERELTQTNRQDNYGATIGLFKMFGKIRTAFQPRIELKNPLQISHSLSFEYATDAGYFLFNPKLEFFASSTKGTGVFNALNLHTSLSDEISVTYINEFEYLDRKNSLGATNGISFGQHISDNDAMAYGFLVFSNNRDNYHLDGYSLSVSWYHILYKKLLDFRLTPRLDFMNAEDFKTTPAATFQITYAF